MEREGMEERADADRHTPSHPPGGVGPESSEDDRWQTKWACLQKACPGLNRNSQRADGTEVSPALLQAQLLSATGGKASLHPLSSWRTSPQHPLPGGERVFSDQLTHPSPGKGPRQRCKQQQLIFILLGDWKCESVSCLELKDMALGGKKRKEVALAGFLTLTMGVVPGGPWHPLALLVCASNLNTRSSTPFLVPGSRPPSHCPSRVLWANAHRGFSQQPR